MIARRALLAVALAIATPALAQTGFPAPREGAWTAPNFRFHTGQTLPEVKLAYRTIGEPSGEPVVILHGTAGSGAAFLGQAFAGQMFGPGQALDARKYFIILPDALGASGSSKPSDGLRAGFPRYTYDDMVLALQRLLTEGMNIRRVRLVMGNSMGGMLAWSWATAYPDFMDAVVPMASQPTEMSSRNWMMRRMIIDGIRGDPEYQGGNYTTQPRMAKFVAVFYGIGTNGGTLALQREAGTREAADRLLASRMAAPFTADANDYVYQWDASRDYNPAPRLGSIRASVLAINAADDERNPPETGLMIEAMRAIPNARLLLIPAGPETTGHGTTGNAKFYARELAAFLEGVPRRGM